MKNIKYNLGDKVWSIQENKVKELVITRIEYLEYLDSFDSYHRKKITKLKYGLGFKNNEILFVNIEEKEVFKTKEDLIKSM